MENPVKKPGAGDQEPGDGTVQCNLHRFKNTTSTSNPGGICAFCLQEKLGKLVSSSFPPHPILPSSSSSPSPSFRSDINGVYGGFRDSSVASSSSSSSAAGKRAAGAQRCRSRMTIPFVSSAAGRRKKTTTTTSGVCSSFERSKSASSAPRRGPQVEHNGSPRSGRTGFWSSIFYLSSSSSKPSDSMKTDQCLSKFTDPASAEEDSSVSQRKVSRSRSVGCGSRSFSGDFFERISNGFGDCTLRRVESQREGNGRPSRSETRRQKAAVASKQESSMIKQRVKCGGIFGGFMLSTSSSSSSSSSSYWVCDEISRATTSSANSGRSRGGCSDRSRGSGGHGWVFASPMRAFSRASSKSGEKVTGDNSDKNKKKNTATAPDLNSIPSLLSVGS